MSDDKKQEKTNTGVAVRFPTHEELLDKGYVWVDFSRLPDLSTHTTVEGYPFPTHEEIIKAGYVESSRRIGRLQGRPKVGQMYWVDFPHDAYSPEFVGEHPGIIFRAGKNLHDTCVVLPVSSTPQKAGSHFHELSVNPNPRGRRDNITAYVVCDHFYTVHVNRLRPLLPIRGNVPVFPRIEPADMDAICVIVKKVLDPAFSFATAAAAEAAEKAVASAARPAVAVRQPGRDTLTLPKK